MSEQQKNEVLEENKEETNTALGEGVICPVAPELTEFSADVKAQLEQYILNDTNIAAYIDKKINEGIQSGLQAALKGTPPKANMTDLSEQEYKNFDKMTYKERLNLFKTNPHTYKKLTGGK